MMTVHGKNRRISSDDMTACTLTRKTETTITEEEAQEEQEEQEEQEREAANSSEPTNLTNRTDAMPIFLNHVTKSFQFKNSNNNNNNNNDNRDRERTFMTSMGTSNNGGGGGGGGGDKTNEGSGKFDQKKLRKARTAFTDLQLAELEHSFNKQKYLAVQDRIELAERLGLNDMQVKTWYQNRRTKWKRQTTVGLELLAEAGNLAAVQRLVEQNPLWVCHPTAKYLFKNLSSFHSQNMANEAMNNDLNLAFDRFDTHKSNASEPHSSFISAMNINRDIIY